MFFHKLPSGYLATTPTRSYCWLPPATEWALQSHHARFRPPDHTSLAYSSLPAGAQTGLHRILSSDGYTDETITSMTTPDIPTGA
jgi:hypothetical protein